MGRRSIHDDNQNARTSLTISARLVPRHGTASSALLEQALKLEALLTSEEQLEELEELYRTYW